MALTCAELISDVQALTGRTGDTELVTNARVARWLNEAQDKIVRACPGLRDTERQDLTSVACLSDTIDYTLGACDPTICYLLEVWYWDGDDSYKLDFLPPDEFAEKYPDPTSADWTPDEPIHWTTYGLKTLRLCPRPSSDEADVTIRLLYTGYADDLTVGSSATSDIKNADDLLISYAVAESWRAIGENNKYVAERAAFGVSLIDYKDHNDLMIAWSHNIAGFDSIE